ncbi:MAG: serine/threonine protein kinase [Oscillospiraceae bacterium]
MSDEKFKVLRSLNTDGSVTLAQNTADSQKYVLKELPPESVSVYRRISEIPPQENLMRVYKIIRQQDRDTAVCEFAEGKTLDELLESRRVFPISEIIRIVTPICKAAQRLHKFGIIHRDITPKNIILDDDLNVKLIDFDISRLYSGERDRDTTIYGTEGYAAPEQYGFMETQFTADIYSIGALLKLLLNSCPDCPIAREVFMRRIAAKCTRLDPQKRYKSAAAVSRAVSRSGWIIPLGAAALSVSVLAAIIAALNIGGALQTTENNKPQTPPVIIIETTESPAESTASTTASTTANTTPTTTATTEQTTVSTQETTLIITQTTTQTTTAKTTQSTTQSTKSTTATTAVQNSEPEVIEALEPLHTSDMDNPKIEITTAKNEDGYYQDYFEYQFYDDPTVHGRWNYFGSLLIPNFSAECEIKQYPVENRIFASLTFDENGQSSAVFANEPSLPLESRWTNGYLICEYGEGTAAQRLFTAEIDSVEYLFIELKVGDFFRDNKVFVYEVFTRAE